MLTGRTAVTGALNSTLILGLRPHLGVEAMRARHLPEPGKALTHCCNSKAIQHLVRPKVCRTLANHNKVGSLCQPLKAPGFSYLGSVTKRVLGYRLPNCCRRPSSSSRTCGNGQASRSFFRPHEMRVAGFGLPGLQANKMRKRGEIRRTKHEIRNKLEGFTRLPVVCFSYQCSLYVCVLVRRSYRSTLVPRTW